MYTPFVARPSAGSLETDRRHQPASGLCHRRWSVRCRGRRRPTRRTVTTPERSAGGHPCPRPRTPDAARRAAPSRNPSTSQRRRPPNTIASPSGHSRGQQRVGRTRSARNFKYSSTTSWPDTNRHLARQPPCPHQVRTPHRRLLPQGSNTITPRCPSQVWDHPQRTYSRAVRRSPAACWTA